MNIEFDYFCNMGKINKILITGASGFVGCRVTNTFKEIFELVTPTHDELDVTSAEEVERFVKETGPDAILHLAAISNTGYCEEHPDESYLTNVVSVENLARAAAAHGCKFVWFSSDQVYNGNLEEGLLSEDMDVSPEKPTGYRWLPGPEYREKNIGRLSFLEISKICKWFSSQRGSSRSAGYLYSPGAFGSWIQ